MQIGIPVKRHAELCRHAGNGGIHKARRNIGARQLPSLLRLLIDKIQNRRLDAGKR